MDWGVAQDFSGKIQKAHLMKVKVDPQDIKNSNSVQHKTTYTKFKK